MPFCGARLWQKDAMAKKGTPLTLIEAMKGLMSTSKYADMVIEVVKRNGDEEDKRWFKVHRCIIAARSNIPVGEQHSTFTVLDTSPDLFDSLLRFMYTDEAGLTDVTVKSMLHLSRKFGVKGMENECFGYLINRLSIQTVLMVFDEGRESNRSDVVGICKEKIMENPDIVQSSQFQNMSSTGIEELLSMDDLNVEESVMFNSLISWAKKKCHERGLEPTTENQKTFLQKSLYKVRFIWLTDEFIRRNVIPSGLLTHDEYGELLEIKATGNFKTKKFLTNRRYNETRCGDNMKCQCRFIEVCNFEDSGSWKCEDDLNAICFSASEAIDFYGVSLYGPRETMWGLYQVLLELYDKAQRVREVKTQILMKKTLVPYQVMFREPIRLRQNHKYDILLRLRGPGTYYGSLKNDELFVRKRVDGCPQFQQPDIPRFRQNGIDFTFYNSHWGTLGETDVHRGQIPEILYKCSSEDAEN